MQGLLIGMTSGGPSLTAAVDALGQGVIDKIVDKFQIGSPSKVMAELGMFTGQGFTQGLAQSGMAEAIAQPMTQAPLAPSVGAAGGQATQITVTVGDTHFLIDGTGKNGEQVAKEAAQSFSSQLLAHLRGLSTEAGR